ncbi:BTB/POZ protein [Rhizophagus irregularis DAOM 181602=DAOM 197198]|nr:BTB/POZ protein [Rhizophagus irregularis DAOM 181602=DAOM 197198]
MSCQTLSNKFLEDINNLYDITDDYNVKIQVGKDSEMEIFQAHSVILRARSKYFHSAFSSNLVKKEGDFYIFKKPNVTSIVFKIILKYIYTGTILGNIENNIIELLLVANEMELHELVEYLQQCIINFNNDWIELNGVKLYDFISHHKDVFPKLQELCNNIMSQKPKLLIDSNEFWGLDDEALLSMIQLDYLEMKEVEIWDNLIKWGIAKNSTLNSDMKTWSVKEYDILKETISKFIQHIRFFQMTSQEYYCKVRPLSKLLPKELEEDLLSHYIVPEYKLATKVLLPRKTQNDKIFDSTILTRKYFNLISYWIDNGQEKLPKFTENTLDLNTIVLSRVVEYNRAIWDSDDNNHGFGYGDLYIFRKSCKLTHYSAKILDSDHFEIDDYEVFQVIEK